MSKSSKQHLILRNETFWGTYGKNPKAYTFDNLQWVLIKDLSDTHIGNIIETDAWHIPSRYLAILYNELTYRLRNSISIPEVDRY